MSRKEHLVILRAPFIYYGGKTRIALDIWDELGQPDHYIEPFFGSGAVLLNRRGYDPRYHLETVNDKDAFVANVWRALKYYPKKVARVCDWPINQVELTARKKRLLRERESLKKRLQENEKWCHIELAAYWIYAASCSIGPPLTSLYGVPQIAGTGSGCHASGRGDFRFDSLEEWFGRIAARLRQVRVTCGDWLVICGGNWQEGGYKRKPKIVGWYFDPPYDLSCRAKVYTEDEHGVSSDVAEWCLRQGSRENYRIVLTGFKHEHPQLLKAGWRLRNAKKASNYANTAKGDSRGKKNLDQEVLYVSPHCVGGKA